LDEVLPGRVIDLDELLHRLSLRGMVHGVEVQERFYEIGSPAGLRDFSAYVEKRGRGLFGHWREEGSALQK
jgi:hypothetical protein